MTLQPIRQLVQVCRNSAKAPHLLPFRCQDASNHTLLVHVQPRTALENDFHHSAPYLAGDRAMLIKRNCSACSRATIGCASSIAGSDSETGSQHHNDTTFATPASALSCLPVWADKPPCTIPSGAEESPLVERRPG